MQRHANSGKPLLSSFKVHLEPRSPTLETPSLTAAIFGMPLLTSFSQPQSIHSFRNCARELALAHVKLRSPRVQSHVNSGSLCLAHSVTSETFTRSAFLHNFARFCWQFQSATCFALCLLESAWVCVALLLAAARKKSHSD